MGTVARLPNPKDLAEQAKKVALDVAAENRLYLAPEALPAIDTMVEERTEVIHQTWRDFETWRGHVRHISTQVANVFKAKKVTRITDPQELLATSRPIYRVYPYD